jgi:hypothetical protein
MLKTELYNHEANGDPPASFATDAEIEIADQLRHRLEERYLAQSETSPPLLPHSSKGRGFDPPSTACSVARTADSIELSED